MLYRAEIKKARVRPRQYFDEGYELYSNRPNELSLEQILGLLTASACIGEHEDFQRLSSMAFEYKGFSKDIEATYYYSVAIALHYRHMKLYTQALEYFDQANKISYLLDDNRLIAASLLYLSSIYGYMQDLETSMRYIKLSLKAMEDVDDQQLMGDINMTLGIIFAYMGENDKMVEAFEQANTNYSSVKGIEEHSNYTILLMNLGKQYGIQGKMAEAEAYLLKAKKYAYANNYKDYKIDVENYLADIYEKSGKVDEAYSALKRYVKGLEAQKDLAQEFMEGHNKDNLLESVTTMTELKDKNKKLSKRIEGLYNQFQTLAEMSTKKQSVVDDIHTALEKGEIVPYFQGKWSFDKHRICGAEALVRWVKSNGEVVGPMDFIGYIESHPVIDNVSEIIIPKALKLCREQLDAGCDGFIVSVNLSSYQLMHHTIVPIIEQALRNEGVKPENLEVEITERSIIDRHPDSINNIERIKALGVRVSLDDFGTGYSSLSSVNDLPFDIIKIDRSLIVKVPEDVKSTRMLESLVRMLKSLDFNVIAEGVENIEQVQLVERIGCDGIQGYYYCKPVPHDEFTLEPDNKNS